MRRHSNGANLSSFQLTQGLFFIECALRQGTARCRSVAAGVVELVDTLGLGPSGGDAVGVQVPPPAPNMNWNRQSGRFRDF